MKILEEANIQAEKIKQEAEEKLVEVYRESYEEATAEAECRSVELVNEARGNAEREAKNILRTADRRIEEVQEKARKNFDTAVDFILNEFTS